MLRVGKYTLQTKPGGPRAGTFSDERIVRIQPLLELLRDIGTVHEKTAAQVAVNWVISKGEQEGFTAIPILGEKVSHCIAMPLKVHFKVLSVARLVANGSFLPHPRLIFLVLDFVLDETAHTRRFCWEMQM